MNVLYWPSIINYQPLPPHSVLYWPGTQLHHLVQLSQLYLVLTDTNIKYFNSCDVSVFAQCELWRGPDKLQLWHPVPSDNYEHPPHQTGFYLSYSASNITTMTTYRHRLATMSISPSSPPWSSSASPGSPSSSLLSRFLAEFPWEWQRYSQWLLCLEASGKTCQGKVQN